MGSIYIPGITEGPKPKTRKPAAPAGFTTSPSRSRSTKPRAQRACKYGPRDASGRCPPKPRASSARRSNASAGTASSSASRTPRTRQSIGEKVLADAAKELVRKLTPTAAQVRRGNLGPVAEVLRRPALLTPIALGALRWVASLIPAATITAVSALAIKLMHQATVAQSAEDYTTAQSLAFAAVTKAAESVPGGFTMAQFDTLVKQHTAYFLDQIRLTRTSLNTK